MRQKHDTVSTPREIHSHAKNTLFTHKTQAQATRPLLGALYLLTRPNLLQNPSMRIRVTLVTPIPLVLPLERLSNTRDMLPRQAARLLTPSIPIIDRAIVRPRATDAPHRTQIVVLVSGDVLLEPELWLGVGGTHAGASALALLGKLLAAKRLCRLGGLCVAWEGGAGGDVACVGGDGDAVGGGLLAAGG